MEKELTLLKYIVFDDVKDFFGKINFFQFFEIVLYFFFVENKIVLKKVLLNLKNHKSNTLINHACGSTYIISTDS